MRITVALIIVGLCAATAHAGVKVEMLCGVYADGKITTPLPAKTKPKIDGKVACAIHLTDAKADNEYLAKLSTVRYTVDAKGKTTKLTTAGVSGEVTHVPGKQAQDLEAYFEANVADGNGEVPFRSCETFDVVGVVGSAAGDVFKKVVHIEQSCPKPKAIKIDVACEARGGGKTLKLPTKDKAGLIDYDTIACTVKTASKITGSIAVTGTASYTGYPGGKKQAMSSGPIAATGSGPWVVSFARTTHWDTCIDVTKLALAVTIDGTRVATSQVDVRQECGGD